MRHKEEQKVKCKSCGSKLGIRGVCMNENCPLYLQKQTGKKKEEGSAMSEMLTKMSPEK